MDVRREGDDIVVDWPDLGLGLEFFRIRETDAAIRSWIRVVSLPERERILAPALFSLSDQTGKKRLAEAISERIDGPTKPSLREWQSSIEAGVAAVLDIHMTPAESIDLATHQVAAESGHLIWPVLETGQLNGFLADQKSGKSYVMMLLAAALASRETVRLPAPMELRKKGPVIYIDVETDADEQTRRLRRVCSGLGLQSLPSIEYIRLTGSLFSQAAEVRRRIDRLQAILVIVDSLTFASGSGDLNSTEVAVAMMNAIGGLGVGVTKAVTAHHGKSGRKDASDISIIGSSAFEFLFRNLWLLRRDSDDDANNIDQAWVHRWASNSRKHRGFGLRLEWDEANTRCDISSLAAGASEWVARLAGTTEEKIRAAILSTEFWKLSTPEIAKATGLSNETIRNWAPRIEGINRVEKGKDGRGNADIWEISRIQDGKPSINRREELEDPPEEDLLELPF